jgi:all-trans-retinol 13,14-reductase
MAKEGEKVLVLEQHKISGGLTQTYERKGLTFPTGVHRLGSLAPGQPLWHYFNYLGLMDKLDLVPLSSNCFEKFHFPDKTFEIPRGHDAFKQQLIHDFPGQSKSIARYFKDLATLMAGINLYDPKVSPKKDISLGYTGSLDIILRPSASMAALRACCVQTAPSTGCPVPNARF